MRPDRFLGLSNEASITVYWVLLIVYEIYLVLTSLVLVKYRREYLISKRCVALCLWGVLFNGLLSAMFITRQIYRPFYPCFVLLWGNNVGIPLFIICSFIARGMKLISEYEWNRVKLADLNRKSLIKYDLSNAKKVLKDSSSDVAEKEKFNLWEKVCIWYIHSKYSTTLFICALCGIHIAITSVLQAVSKSFSISPMKFTDCKGREEMYPLYLSFALYGILGCPLILYRLNNVVDAYGIKSDIVKSILVGFPCYALFLLWKHASFMEMPRVYMPSTFIILWGLIAYHTSSVTFPVFRTFWHKRKGDPSSPFHPPLSLKDALNDQTLLTKFRKFTVTEFAVENLLFYETCTEFKSFHKRQLGSSNASVELFKQNIEAIYDQFIKPGSAYEVNIMEVSRKNIEEQMLLPQPSLDIFEAAKDEIYYLMLSWSFPRFLKTLKQDEELPLQHL